VASKQTTVALVFHPRHRQSVLNQRRTLKMARSAHAYVSGSTVQFYEWLNSTRAKSIPQGPPIWICGDCHLGNLGPVADANGRVRIAIRDLDQTVIGNPAHDLVRLALSLATAIRGSDLPGVTTAMVLEQMALGYVEALAPRGTSKHPGKTPRAVSRILDRSYKRRWHHLAEERIEDVTPKIPRQEFLADYVGRTEGDSPDLQRCRGPSPDNIFKRPEGRR
jgi:uncharacterized protein (DUF2252 family)